MGFEDYCVLLRPRPSQDLVFDSGNYTIEAIANLVRTNWDPIVVKQLDRGAVKWASRDRSIIHMEYENSLGLIQLEIAAISGDPSISVRFACCNPKTVVEPFCTLVAWLMEKFQMNCHLMRDPAHDQEVLVDPITDPVLVYKVLTPGIALQRRYWEIDSGILDDHIVTPEHAIELYLDLQLSDDARKPDVPHVPPEIPSSP